MPQLNRFEDTQVYSNLVNASILLAALSIRYPKTTFSGCQRPGTEVSSGGYAKFWNAAPYSYKHLAGTHPLP